MNHMGVDYAIDAKDGWEWRIYDGPRASGRLICRGTIEIFELGGETDELRSVATLAAHAAIEVLLKKGTAQSIRATHAAFGVAPHEAPNPEPQTRRAPDRCAAHLSPSAATGSRW